MLRRALSTLLLIWVLGFLGFAVSLPGPAPLAKTDAVAALTGGEGRIARALEVLGAHNAHIMLVSGVDSEVRPAEFAKKYQVAPDEMACCVTLGFQSVDTRSNAVEVAGWVAAHQVTSLRLVTSDWHMRRAAFELLRVLPSHVMVTEDAVPTRPSFNTLFVEYNKFLARHAATLWGGR